MSTPQFPQLTAHGNYLDHPPAPLITLPTDGVSLRAVKKLGLPYVPVVEVYQHAFFFRTPSGSKIGQHFYPYTIGYAVWPADAEKVKAFLAARKPEKSPAPHPDICICTQEASRAAHRERDEAEVAYLDGRHSHASRHKRHKEGWYALKEHGIAALFLRGDLRFAGLSPQGMAVYEYGVGGKQCFHSLLIPRGVETPTIADHPEVLFVPAKQKAPGISLARVRVTLEALPKPDMGKFRRPGECVDCVGNARKGQLHCGRCAARLGAHAGQSAPTHPHPEPVASIVIAADPAGR